MSWLIKFLFLSCLLIGCLVEGATQSYTPSDTATIIGNLDMTHLDISPTDESFTLYLYYLDYDQESFIAYFLEEGKFEVRLPLDMPAEALINPIRSGNRGSDLIFFMKPGDTVWLDLTLIPGKEKKHQYSGLDRDSIDLGQVQFKGAFQAQNEQMLAFQRQINEQEFPKPTFETFKELEKIVPSYAKRGYRQGKRILDRLDADPMLYQWLRYKWEEDFVFARLASRMNVGHEKMREVLKDRGAPKLVAEFETVAPLFYGIYAYEWMRDFLRIHEHKLRQQTTYIQQQFIPRLRQLADHPKLTPSDAELMHAFLDSLDLIQTDTLPKSITLQFGVWWEEMRYIDRDMVARFSHELLLDELEALDLPGPLKEQYLIGRILMLELFGHIEVIRAQVERYKGLISHPAYWQRIEGILFDWERLDRVPPALHLHGLADVSAIDALLGKGKPVVVVFWEPIFYRQLGNAHYTTAPSYMDSIRAVLANYDPHELTIIYLCVNYTTYWKDWRHVVQQYFVKGDHFLLKESGMLDRDRILERLGFEFGLMYEGPAAPILVLVDEEGKEVSQHLDESIDLDQFTKELEAVVHP